MRLIKGKSVQYALGLLGSVNNSIAPLVLRLLKSACANAGRFPDIDESQLFVSNVYANGGPLLKRYRAEAMGRASVLRKPTAHITIELDIKAVPSKAVMPADKNKKSAGKVLRKRRPGKENVKQAADPKKKARV